MQSKTLPWFDRDLVPFICAGNGDTPFELSTSLSILTSFSMGESEGVGVTWPLFDVMLISGDP